MKKSNVLLAVFIACVFVGAPLFAYGPSILVEYDTDRQGGDYRSMDVSGIGECMDTCAKDAQCVGFTYVHQNKQPPNYNNPTPKCWLKKSVTGKRSDDCCISGVKQ